MNPVQPAQHSHTQLYIVIGLLVVFAILFFSFKIGQENTATRTTPQTNTMPLGLNRIILTTEQIVQKEAIMSDPSLYKQTTLTPAEYEKKKAIMESVNKARADETIKK